MTAQSQSNMPHLKGITKSNAKKIAQLVQSVAEEAGMEARAIYGPDQDQYAVAFRRALWWCLREGHMMTYQNIAQLFTSANGGRFNYSSVIAGCNKVREEGMLVFSEHKGQWVARESGASCSDKRLRQALQVVASVWNKMNPQNQLNTWTNSL